MLLAKQCSKYREVNSATAGLRLIVTDRGLGVQLIKEQKVQRLLRARVYWKDRLLTEDSFSSFNNWVHSGGDFDSWECRLEVLDESGNIIAAIDGPKAE